MNYERIYSDFIADRLTKQPVKPSYFEKHHIVPRSLGGGDEKSNIIRLTAEDHIYAHLFLARWLQTGGMWAAVKFIFGQGVRLEKRPTRRAIRIAAKAKEEFAKNNSGAGNVNFGKPMPQEQREKLRKANIGKKLDPETIEKIRAASTGNAYALGFKHSAETRKKVAIANTGRQHSEETKARMSASSKGIKKTDEHRKKLSAAKSGKPRTWAVTQATRDKLSAAASGRFVSVETRSKQSAARIGLRPTDDTKQKMSAQRKGAGNSRAKPVECCSTGVIFGCVKDAADTHSISSSSLRRALSNGNGKAMIGGIDFRLI